MNADGARFERSDLAHGVSVFRIPACGKRHRRGKGSAFSPIASRSRARNPRQPAGGSFRLRLKLIVQDSGGISLALHDAQRRSMRDVDETSDVEIGHVMHDLLVSRRVRGSRASVIGGEKKLTDFFVHRHFAQCVLPPTRSRQATIFLSRS